MNRESTQSQWEVYLDQLEEEEFIALSEIMSPNDIGFDRILEHRVEARLVQETLER